MTNSYAIIRAIAKIEGMSYAEKFAGAMLALHLDRKKNQITVKQATLAKECGLTTRCVQGAIAKIVKAGVLARVRKSRCLMLIPQMSPEESVLYAIRTAVRMTDKKKPWEYDPKLTTRTEEEYKRLCRRLDSEEVGKSG